MSERDNFILIQDILEPASNIMEYVGEITLYEEFIKDKKTVDAIIRNFEIIGEAISKISKDFKSQHPLVEWREMSDFRNTVIHDYFGVDLEIVWSAIHHDLAFNIELIKKTIL